MAGLGLWLGGGTTVLPIRVVVRWRHRHTPDLEYCVTLHLFNSNNFVTSAALAEVCALPSAIFWLFLIFPAIMVNYNNRFYIVFLICLNNLVKKSTYFSNYF